MKERIGKLPKSNRNAGSKLYKDRSRKMYMQIRYISESGLPFITKAVICKITTDDKQPGIIRFSFNEEIRQPRKGA